MAKQLFDQLSDNLAKRKTTDKRPTEDPQKTDKRRTLGRYQFRLEPDDYQAVTQAFARDGLSFSAGIRMLIRRYLNR